MIVVPCLLKMLQYFMHCQTRFRTTRVSPQDSRIFIQGDGHFRIAIDRTSNKKIIAINGSLHQFTAGTGNPHCGQSHLYHHTIMLFSGAQTILRHSHRSLTKGFHVI